MATYVEVLEGQQWIENEFWTLLPGKRDRPGNRVQWNWNSDGRQYTMRPEVDGKRGGSEFTDEEIRDSLADRTVQKKLKRRIRTLAKSFE